MRTITCTNLGSGVTAISVGSTYEIINESGSRYTIINDRGIQANYGKNLFSAPVEVPQPQAEGNAPARRGRPARAQQAVEAGVVNAAPAPAPVRVVNEIGIETSASIDEDQISFRIDFDFGNGLSHRSDARSIIESRGINASCGIQSLSGINSLNSFLLTARNSFDRFVAENSARFTLSPELSIDELFSALTTGVIQDLISAYQGEDADIRAGLLIVSTTENAFNENPSLRSTLDTVSASQTSVFNPNSGNQIVTWVIPVEEPAV